MKEKVTITTRDEHADMEIMVCGCPVCCVDKDNTKTGVSKWHIVGPDMLDYKRIPLSEIPAKLFSEIVSEVRKKC